MDRPRIFLSLVALLAAGNAVAGPLDGQGSGLGMYKARRLAEVRPYDDAKRLETHRVMRRLGELSLEPRYDVKLADIPSGVGPPYASVLLYDNDNDLSADFFLYLDEDTAAGLAGFLFSLTEGGPPSWIVFPVGAMEGDDGNFFLAFDHWVDRNEDGMIDMIVTEGLDLDRSGKPEAGTAAFLLDGDFDGLVDDCIICQPSGCETAVLPDGSINRRRVLDKPGEGIRVGQDFPGADILNGIFADLRRATEGGGE